MADDSNSFKADKLRGEDNYDTWLTSMQALVLTKGIKIFEYLSNPPPSDSSDEVSYANAALAWAAGLHQQCGDTIGAQGQTAAL